LDNVGPWATGTQNYCTPRHRDGSDVMRARKNAAAEAGENERGSAPHRCVCAHRHAQPPRGTQRVALGASKRRRARSHRFRTRATAVIVCAFTGNMCPGKKRVDQAFVCEGLDENSWQSRPRHAVLSPTPGRLPPRGTTAADLARVMLLLDASTIANTARLCSWHACASVWIATSFRQRPRIHKHANAWWSMHLHKLLLDTSKAQLAYVSDLCRHHRHMHGNHRRVCTHRDRALSR